ncbi:MAG: hypothetical protein LBI05_07100, partial [Planctomycetaceae bacterium]|nr:hypothetical protein [Planctomycetaceae bacterium]
GSPRRCGHKTIAETASIFLTSKSEKIKRQNLPLDLDKMDSIVLRNRADSAPLLLCRFGSG